MASKSDNKSGSGGDENVLVQTLVMLGVVAVIFAIIWALGVI